MANKMETKKPAAVILAGGRSSRMGGQRKALLELGGQPLLTHVVKRIRPQVDGLLLSCEGATDDFESFGLPLVADLLPGHRGPLTGLFSALQYLEDRGRQRAHDSHVRSGEWSRLRVDRRPGSDRLSATQRAPSR